VEVVPEVEPVWLELRAAELEPLDDLGRQPDPGVQVLEAAPPVPAERLLGDGTCPNFAGIL
jgi:hypothetical protein